MRMPSRLSIKDINFIQPLFWHLGWFLITPWYDFRTCVTTKPNLAKLYGLILISVKISPFVYAACDHYFQTLLRKFFPSQIIFMSVIGLNVITLNMLTVLKVCLFDVNLWRKMLTNLQYLDTKLKNVGKVEHRILKSFYMRIAFKHVLFGISAAFSLYVWSQVLEMPLWKIFLLTGSVEMYSEFLGAVVLLTFIRIFRVRYKDLNTRLKRISKRDKFVHEVKSLAQSYQLLGETVDIFNRIFGYQIVLIIFHTGSQAILAFNSCVLIFTEVIGDFQYFFALANIWILAWILHAFLLVVLEMNSTILESRRFIDLLYKVQDELSEKSDEMAVVKRLIGYSKNFRRGFSGAGFFSVDKGIVFSVMGNVATYLIITIQLNAQNKKIARED